MSQLKPYEPFDSKGQIILPTAEQLSTMTPAARENVQAVLDAHAALAEAEKAHDAHRTKVEELTRQIADASNTLTQLAPKITFQHLWEQMKASS